MKNKIRIFAAFAAAAVAVSMLAFTGCGESEPDKGDNGDTNNSGVIEGDYKDKTDEEVKDIVENIKPDDLFGDLEAEDASLGVHITENMEAGLSMTYIAVNGTVNLDYKMYADATDYVAGMGTVGVKANYVNMITDTGAPQMTSIDVSASLYNDMQYAYGTVTGLGDSAMTGKLDIEKLMTSFGGAGDFSLLDAIAPNEPEADEDEMTSWWSFNAEAMIEMLAMAKQFDIAVTFDISDGVKVKLSASEETVWKLLTESEVDEEMIAQVKEAVTFNKFLYDVYFSIDADGKFDRASEVMDIEISVDSSILVGMMDEDVDIEMPPITAYVKGSTVISTFSEKLTIPETVKAYDDMTDTVIELIQSMMPGDEIPEDSNSAEEV